MPYTARDADYIIRKAFAHGVRKATPPASGTSKYNTLLEYVDSGQKDWQDEPNTQWNSLYLSATGGPVTTSQTYTLPTTIREISKRPDDRLILTDGTQEKRYKIVEPNQLDELRLTDCVAQIGRTLKFSQPFDADSSLIGYDIIVPGYGYVGDVTTGASVIDVPDPMWLAYYVAAEYIRGDIVRQNQYNNLLALADQHMQKMKQDNMAQNSEPSFTFQASGESWI